MSSARTPIEVAIDILTELKQTHEATLSATQQAVDESNKSLRRINTLLEVMCGNKPADMYALCEAVDLDDSARDYPIIQGLIAMKLPKECFEKISFGEKHDRMFRDLLAAVPVSCKVMAIQYLEGMKKALDTSSKSSVYQSFLVSPGIAKKLMEIHLLLDTLNGRKPADVRSFEAACHYDNKENEYILLRGLIEVGLPRELFSHITFGEKFDKMFREQKIRFAAPGGPAF